VTLGIEEHAVIRSCAWMVVVLALCGCSKGDSPPSRSEAKKLAAELQAAEEKRTDAPLVSEPPAPPASPAAEAAPASPIDRAELVSAFEADLRSNARLSAGERRQMAEVLADDWIGLQQGLQDAEARNRAIGKAMDAKYGTVDDIKRKECEWQRVELNALERMAKGPPGEIRTEQEKADLPRQIDAHRSRLQQMCP